jgi:hypothetical protein
MRDSNRSAGRDNPIARGNRVLLPYLILLIGLCFTVLVYYYFSKLTFEQDQSNFGRAVQQIQDQVRLRTETSITLLRSGTGLFAASDSVERTNLNVRQQIELEKNYPGVQGSVFTTVYARRKPVSCRDETSGREHFKFGPMISAQRIQRDRLPAAGNYTKQLRNRLRHGDESSRRRQWNRARFRKSNRFRARATGPGT